MSAARAASRTAQSKRDQADALYERQARICQALADPTRLKLLDLLRQGEHAVGELAKGLETSYPNISRHLGIMRDAGIVASRKEGTNVFYRLAYPEIAEACDLVRRVLGAQLAEAADIRRGLSRA